jgi:hypothetical protein
VHLWHPPYCGESDIRIARDGRWYHQGSLIQRPQLVKLFASILRREQDGTYSLVTPVERLGIQVDACPFVATGFEHGGEGRHMSLDFMLNTEEKVMADQAHRLDVHLREQQPYPLLHVRAGLYALLSRNAYYALVDLATEEIERQGKKVLCIWSRGERFELGSF